MSMRIISDKIARKALEIRAIKVDPKNPFEWASGYMMPIYNDNRMFLEYPQSREFIARSFMELMSSMGYHDHFFHVIAGTSTAGISPATTLADILKKSLIYVRDKPKGHGLKNQIEGIDADSDLGGRRVLLIEDLISTGGSSAKAVQAIRNANGACDHCFSIFDYELDSAKSEFNKLDRKCEVKSLLTFNHLLEVAIETGYLKDSQLQTLREWREDPFNWGEKHGFPKIEKNRS
jgi:orotate phosphoribosyltransferase